MKENYKAFVDRMIQRYEGGYGWDHADPGGPTNFGITCFDLAEHRHQKMTSMSAWAPLVRAMSLQEAEDIYASKYATACRFYDLNSGPDCAIFDFGVNSGPSRAIKYAQMVVDTSRDGILGPITLAAINKMDPDKFVDNLCDLRLSFLRHLSTWPSFGKGWTSRVSDLRSYSHRIAINVPMTQAGSGAKAMSPLEQWLTPDPSALPSILEHVVPISMTALTPTQTATIHSGVHNLIKREMNTLITSVVPSMFQSMATSYVEGLATKCADDITKFVGDQFK